MNCTFDYFLNEKKFTIISNSLYVRNILQRELMKANLEPSSNDIKGTADGIIEIKDFDSSYGDFLFNNQSIIGENIDGGSKILQLSSANSIQPMRIFLNSIVAQKHADIVLPLHASTYLKSGKGFAICGAKNSGKSSLTLANVLWGEGNFVADDITFLSYKGFHTHASGLFRGIHIASSEAKFFKHNYMSGKKMDKIDEFKERIIFDKSVCLENTKLDYILFTRIVKTKRNWFKISKINDMDELFNLLINNTVNFNFSMVQQQEKLVKKILNSSIETYQVELGTDINESFEQINQYFL